MSQQQPQSVIRVAINVYLVTAVQNVRFWDGHDWEQYCLLLIRRHYGADQVQEVPAGHGGDLGIEAFCYEGSAFQCYAAEEPLTTSDRYSSQRDKLTTDLSKLVKNQSELTRLLGRVQINRYIFMVPHHDSHKLVQHASTKAEEYRAKDLTILGPDFQVMILTDKAFAKERSEVLERQRSLVDIHHAESGEISRWMGDNTGLVQTLDGKLSRLPFDATARGDYLGGLITNYVDGNNAFDRIRSEFPDQWEDIARCRTNKERMLSLEHPPSAVSEHDNVKDIAVAFQHELQEMVPAMDRELSRVLSWAAVAEWLMRCPLGIREREDSAV